MNVAAAIAEILKREGVDILFGYPRNAVLEAAASADIRTVIVRQERTGLHMADAYSRMSSGDKIGVFCMQHGPGAENAFGGVAQAFSESSPILVIRFGGRGSVAWRCQPEKIKHVAAHHLSHIGSREQVAHFLRPVQRVGHPLGVRVIRTEEDMLG